jgi:hypothetical protein
MADALARHDELLATAVARHRGVLLKTKGEGDSTFSVFTRASDAAAAALAAQQALGAEDWATAVPLSVRMALHTGEALERDGDYYGRTVNRVARLRAIAAPGLILTSQSSAEVIRDHLPPEATLAELGDHDLKDLARPERVFALTGPGMATAPTRVDVDAPAPIAQLPLPAPLASAVGVSFVGRDPELLRLHTLWKHAGAGNRQAVFLAGEPGIGKTRLAAELAHSAHAEGATVFYGRCDEDLEVPYSPSSRRCAPSPVTFPRTICAPRSPSRRLFCGRGPSLPRNTRHQRRFGRSGEQTSAPANSDPAAVCAQPSSQSDVMS